MSFAQPLYLTLLAAALVVLLLALLRTQQLRREVGALFIWETLRDSTSVRTRILRRLLDPLLLMQLAVIAALALSAAQPLWRTQSPAWARLAIVIDGSASMRTIADDDGHSRYRLAADEADRLMRAAPSTAVTVVELSTLPRILVRDERSRDDIGSALAASAATWLADATSDDLLRALASSGGVSSFDKILLLTDHPLADLPPTIQEVIISGGTNLGITAFSLRRNTTGDGVTAFVELYNGTEEYRDARVLVGDEFGQVSLSVFLEPGEKAPFVVPFPSSRGTRFTASLVAEDDYPADNTRYAALPQVASLAVRWIGSEDRFLLAALESVLPIHQITGDGQADLTVVNNASIQALPNGNVLLVHSTVAGLFAFTASSVQGHPRAETADALLLTGIEPDDLYVQSTPSLTSALPLTPLLTLGSVPILAAMTVEDRLLVVLTPNLSATNLPITVDFPILIHNLIALVAPPETGDALVWNLVGEPINLSRRAATSVREPDGDLLPVGQQLAFYPSFPGHYGLETPNGEFPVAVNVASEESWVQEAESTQPAAIHLDATTRNAEPREIPLWPPIAAVAALLLIGEFALYQRYTSNRSGA
jgi:hypothetical protein